MEDKQKCWVHSRPKPMNSETKKIINVSEKAIFEISRRIEGDKTKGDGLRLGIKGGGCSGLSYIINIDFKKEDDLIQKEKDVKIYMDKRSSLYLKGSILEFEGGFMGSGFKFKNPNASNTCGCGESFSI